MDPYILDLANMMLEMDDEDLAQKNFLACCFAMSIQRGISPAATLTEMLEHVPDYDDWFENWLHFLQGLKEEA